MYKIEKKIPFGKPKEKEKPASKYPFRKMVDGDSFFVEGDAKKIQSVRMSLHFFKKATNPKYIYKTRLIGTGVRVWCFSKVEK